MISKFVFHDDSFVSKTLESIDETKRDNTPAALELWARCEESSGLSQEDFSESYAYSLSQVNFHFSKRLTKEDRYALGLLDQTPEELL